MDKIMDINMGGEVAKFLAQWSGRSIKCYGTCQKKQEMDQFLGYEHEGGLEDAKGKKWWVYFQCPKCRYQHSFSKMVFFNKHTKIEEKAEQILLPGESCPKCKQGTLEVINRKGQDLLQCSNLCGFTYEIKITVEPMTADDYEDIKAIIKQTANSCPICKGQLKEEDWFENGVKVDKVMACTECGYYR